MKEDPGFNWVKARYDCSAEKEFLLLRQTVLSDTKERKKCLKPEQRDYLEYIGEGNDIEFMVRSAFGPASALFTLKGETIVVQISKAEKIVKTLKLTLTLNDEGECRFRIDGEREYLRWQVARKALEEIFFCGLYEPE